MKKIVCELCDGMDFAKADGMFTCQGCGTKYTLEQAKAMMIEVEGDAVPATPATPVQSVPMGNPNQAQIDNLLLLATTAYDADNLAEAESYCNRIIELDAMCYKAWYLKGRAVGWSSKVDNNRFEEASYSFCKAIDFAPEDEKENLKDDAVDELRRLGLALIDTRRQRFSKWPDKEELNGFTRDRNALVKSLKVFLQHGNIVGMPEGYLEAIATKMNIAAVAGFEKIRDEYNAVDYPSERDFDKYLDGASNCAQLVREAIDASDDDDDADVQRYKNLIIILKDGLDKCSYDKKYDTYRGWYHVKQYSLTAEAKESRNKEVRQCEARIKEIEEAAQKKKEEEERMAKAAKQARIDAYWAEHADEKKSLEDERADLIMKKESLSKEIGELNKRIKKIENEANVSTPSEDEKKKIQSQISDLKTKKAGLGLFAGKEKKQIDEEISVLEGRLPTLDKKIQEEKSDITKSIISRKQPLLDQGKALGDEVAKMNKRITEIDNRFKEDPEE